jgi:hypothetical protein
VEALERPRPKRPRPIPKPPSESEVELEDNEEAHEGLLLVAELEGLEVDGARRRAAREKVARAAEDLQLVPLDVDLHHLVRLEETFRSHVVQAVQIHRLQVHEARRLHRGRVAEERGVAVVTWDHLYSRRSTLCLVVVKIFICTCVKNMIEEQTLEDRIELLEESITTLEGKFNRIEILEESITTLERKFNTLAKHVMESSTRTKMSESAFAMYGRSSRRKRSKKTKGLLQN